MNVRFLNRRQFLPLSILVVATGWVMTRQDSPVKFKVPEVEPAFAKALIEAGALIVDVRSQKAFETQHLPNAMLVSLSALKAAIPASLLAAKEKQIVVYCADGASSGPEGTHILQSAGFNRVANLRTGIEGWVAGGLPVVTA